MTTAIQKIQAIAPRAAIVATYPDSDRYKFGFGVASQSSGRIYKISFDAARGALYWKCSCPGNITHGRCKHLQACGLKGRADMLRHEGIDFAKKHGFIQ